MPVVCKELLGLELAADPAKPGGTIKYVVTGTTDPAEAQLNVLATSPATATISVPVGSGYETGTVYRLSNTVTELGGGVWLADVAYGIQQVASVAAPSNFPPGVPPTSPPPRPSQQPKTTDLGPEFSFDTGGGTTKLTQSQLTRQRLKVLANGVLVTDGAPDVMGAIGATDGGVEGVEVVTGQLAWTITVRRASVELGYLQELQYCTGKLNEAVFFDHNAEEVLYLGASGQFKPGEGWHVTHKFASGFHRDVYVVPGAPPLSQVPPFDHIWVNYETKTLTNNGEKVNLQVPKFVYQEQVYETADFEKLEV